MDTKIALLIGFDLRLAYYVRMGYAPKVLNAMHALRVAFIRTMTTPQKIEYYGVTVEGIDSMSWSDIEETLR